MESVRLLVVTHQRHFHEQIVTKVYTGKFCQNRSLLSQTIFGNQGYQLSEDQYELPFCRSIHHIKQLFTDRYFYNAVSTAHDMISQEVISLVLFSGRNQPEVSIINSINH